MVPLDQADGDGRWVLRARGAPARVLAEAEAAARAVSTPDALARVALARALAARFPGPVLDLTLDLRRAEVGVALHSRRLGSSQEVWTRLPWLLLTSGGAELVVVRTLHRRETRTFRQEVERRSARAAIDELRVRLPDGRGLRRALRGAASLADVSPASCTPDVPGLDTELPATAPGSAFEQRAPGSAGLLVGAALLLALPWLSAPGAAAPPPRDDEDLKLALLANPPAATVRAGLGSGVRERRREALVASVRVLPARERWRALRAAATDRDRLVRELALGLLAQDGALGAATVAELAGPGRDPALRADAFRQLLDRRDPRTLGLALSGLAGNAPDSLRRLWIEGLGETATIADRDALEILRETLRGADLELRAQAAWALARRIPWQVTGEVTRAFEDAVAAVRELPDSPTQRAALLTLARALQRARPGAPALRAAAADASLEARVRRQLQRLLQAL
ncbi:MAG: HEAT repeat domain-containing protein [Planctomycetota bacterium]